MTNQEKYYANYTDFNALVDHIRKNSSLRGPCDELHDQICEAPGDCCRSCIAEWLKEEATSIIKPNHDDSEPVAFKKDEAKEIETFDEDVTFEGVFKDFKKHHRFLGKHAVDYRPGPEPYTIRIWLDIENATTGSREVIYSYETKELGIDRRAAYG